MCFPNILVKKQTNIWIPQNKSQEWNVNLVSVLLPDILIDDAASTYCEKS